MIKISVATITLNAHKYIKESILSVINQTYCNFEYIVIDGGSTDGTLDILKSYGEKIKWISEPDKGIYDAMNKALDIAGGDFIIFLGADDHFLSFDTLSTVSMYIKDTDNVYYGNVYRNSRNDIYKGAFNKYKISLENICHQSILYPKCIYKSLRYETRYRVYADYFYNLTIFPICKFVYMPVTISYYNCEGYSSTVKDEAFERIVNSYVRFQNGMFAYLLRKFYLLYKRIR